ncbi:hypothetical protein SH449x_000925 [Pirellulaceae bacterium SH449]
MSDHWNSLANLLGTPSLSPQSKKGADTAPRKTSEPKLAETKEFASQEESATPAMEVAKSVAKEPSKLRSGWDAVTSFFGIQTSSTVDSNSDSEPTGSTPTQRIAGDEIEFEPKQDAHSRGSKKSRKPSFWDEGKGRPEPVKESVERAASTTKADDFSSTTDEPIVSFGDRKRNRNERKTEDSRDRSREKSSGRREPIADIDSDAPAKPARGNRTERLPKPAAQVSLPDADDADDADGPVERRAPRRAPRRGRSDDSETGIDVESVEVASSPTRESRGRRDQPRRDRSERTPTGSDRPERSKPVRDSISDESVVEPRGQARRQDRHDRTSDSNDAGDRPARRNPRPTRAPRLEEVGFGAGLKDAEDVDSFEDDELFVEVSDSIDAERSEEGPRRGRNPRRGRKSSGRTRPNSDDSARMEADESEKKFIKVPSWIEALDGILQSNMDNHQRNSHGRDRDRHRGRGPRNSDR